MDALTDGVLSFECAYSISEGVLGVLTDGGLTSASVLITNTKKFLHDPRKVNLRCFTFNDFNLLYAYR